MGAYYQLLTPGIPVLGGWLYMGPYDPQAYWFEFTGVFTNCTPTDAYRGAGRPEATYVIERAVDALARKVGKDPAEVRRMNFHPPFPRRRPRSWGCRSTPGTTSRPLDRALEMVGYDAAPQGAAGPPRRRRRPSSSGSGCPPTSRCAAWRPSNPGRPPLRGRRLGRRPRSGCLPTGKVVVGPAPRRTARATRRPGRRSWPTGSASPRRRRGAALRHRRRAARHGHVRLAVGGGRRRGAARAIENRRKGAHDRRPRARGRRGGPRVRGRPLHGEGRAGQGADDPGAGDVGVARARPARAAWSPTSRRPPCYDPPNFTWPVRGRTSAWSRSTPRPAPSTSSSTSPSTTAAR